MSQLKPLTQLSAGMPVLVGGDQVIEISEELARAFEPGDALCPVAKQGVLLHIPRRERELAREAVDRAHRAFQRMGAVTDEQVSKFYEEFASRLEDEAIWGSIQSVNDADVAAARARGRSTTRLVADDKLRKNVIAGLRGWISAESRRGKTLERVQHDGWCVDLVGAELGVIGFIFEGRPNVVADATGVLRGGNTVVFRIGRDALATAKAIVALALEPALAAAGLPEGAVSVVDSPSHAAGWALFGDRRLSLAVARGSGEAVETLGSIAQQAGVPVSLHGTGGAWIVASVSTQAEQLENVVARSLDRKVCNTLNTLCIPVDQAAKLVPAALAGLERAGAQRGQAYKLHVARQHADLVPAEQFSRQISVVRANGPVTESQAQLIDDDQLGHEWEWEDTPEITLVFVDSTQHAVELFNQQSPQFVASLLSQDQQEHEQFYKTINAPFIGDGFTRWVDGQFALRRPELGLSNWANGRLFGRGGVLSGDSVFTVRTRMRHSG